MSSTKKHIKSILLLSFLVSLTAFGQLKLPKLLSDGVILQRDTKVNIWGWAAVHEKISIRFNDSLYQTTANDSGEWEVILSNLLPGGPYTMTLSASDTINIKNILVGDVWLCSGQSNMELPMSRVSQIYEHEIANSDNTNIRCFTVPQIYNFNAPQKDLISGNWQAANPDNVLSFSATAYFFAKELYEKYQVPIGLINASIGGTPIEAWMSEESLKDFPNHYQELQRLKENALIDSIEQRDKRRMQDWYVRLQQKDEGYKNQQTLWYDTSFNSYGWVIMNVPGFLSETELGAVNGVVWFKKEITLPASFAGQKARLILGRIVDADSVFINGKFIGTTGYQYPPRRYEIPSNVLKEGKNSIVVRIISNSGNGGFVPDKSYEIIANGQTIDLKGPWQYRLGAIMEPLAGQTFVKYKPAGLFNAMIAPLLNCSIKGVIWYQGESNADRPLEYRYLFPALIQDWRKHWNRGDFPFLFVQLPNFMEPKSQPSESNWALFREAQMKTLSLSNTGMAVTIDIGEWNDVHPLNKKDVGKRLALSAQKFAYGGDTVTYSGPLYRTMKRTGNKILLTFDNTGSGLIARGGGRLRYFSIAGYDKKFVWANATIKNNKVLVWSDHISSPAAVRYAWADNPEGANLYNKEGLPASPFRTDR